MRRLLAGAMAGLMLLSGCAPGEPKPAPSPSVTTTPPKDLPAADAAALALAKALTAHDVSALPMVKAASDAQQEFDVIFAGMDGIYPTVEPAGVTYEGDDQAVAQLSFTYDLGLHGWEYQSTARFHWVTDTWRLEWAPTVIHPKLTSDSRLRHTHKEPRRGAINDNEGLALVEEGTRYEVGIDKSAVDAKEASTAANTLATILKLDKKAYVKKVEASGAKAFVIAATLDQADIPASVSDVSGVLVREITAVVGPGDGLAAPLLGTVGTPTKEMIAKSEGKLSTQDRVGLSGLQARYDDVLRGVPEVRVDQVGRKVEGKEQTFEEQNLFEQQASVSTAIDTSLDRALQQKAEKVLSKQKGLATLVVLDLKSGALLAAAQSPSGGTFPYATYGKYAPGSTFKTVTSLAMLRDGLSPNSSVTCSSSLKVSTYTFGNYSGYPSSALGTISLTDAFKYSCNTVFAGSKVDGDQLADAAASLGVGVDYDAGFTSYFGTVAPSNTIDLAASKIGQGQVTMSPLGMAAVAASIGSGNTTIPWLVKGHEATSTAKPLTESEASELRSMMKATVDSGTGKSLQGIMTGAKTGTAEWGKKGKQQTHAWMVAYNDRYAVSAFVEVGDSGGTTAAPLIAQLFG
ncbi:MAG: penicillin-binding transpeptidase domain-containing protein [Arachnia sp.]